MKILTDDHWELIVGQLELAQERIKELEAQVSGLLDRLLIEKGQVPLNLGLHKEMRDQEQAHHDLFTELTQEEVGEDPKDDVDS